MTIKLVRITLVLYQLADAGGKTNQMTRQEGQKKTTFDD